MSSKDVEGRLKSAVGKWNRRSIGLYAIHDMDRYKKIWEDTRR